MFAEPAEIFALAEALQVSASELTRLPIPAPANGHTDSSIKATGQALDAIEVGCPGGMVLPLDVLREQVTTVHRQRGTCHLIRRVVFLALRLAHERDDITTLAVARYGVAHMLSQGGSFDLAQAELEAITLPPTTADTASLIGELTAVQALIATLTSRAGDAVTLMTALPNWLTGSGLPAKPALSGSCTDPWMRKWTGCGSRSKRTSPTRQCESPRTLTPPGTRSR